LGSGYYSVQAGIAILFEHYITVESIVRLQIQHGQNIGCINSGLPDGKCFNTVHKMECKDVWNQNIHETVYNIK